MRARLLEASPFQHESAESTPRQSRPRRLQVSADHEYDMDEEEAGGWCSVLWVVCVVFGCRRGCTGLVAMVVGASVALWIGITRNLYCNPEYLQGVEPPYGGQLMPENITLVERKYFFQFTKYVDVYEDTGKHVGYFYDINLFFIMRFGFSDALHRIWFEARYASFFSRFKPIVEYNIQRCDAGAGGRLSDVFELKEDWMAEMWICIFHCNRLFNLSVRESPYHITEGLLPRSGFGVNAVARVVMDSNLTPTLRSRITGPIGVESVGLRHKWGLEVWNSTDMTGIASASQVFVIGGATSNMRLLSRWRVRTLVANDLPNWVIGFLAVLDDIDEDLTEHR